MRVNRKYLLLGVDLAWVAIAPIAALLIRDHFSPRAEALSATIAYAILGVAIAAVVFPIAGLNRTLWRYTSLSELVRLQIAVTVTVLLAMLGAFAHTRLIDISRSLPMLQWFLLVAAMTVTRLAIRVWRERGTVPQQHTRVSKTEQVLIVGVNRLAEVYVRALNEFGRRRFSIVGFLTKESSLRGRLLQSYKILGVPEDLLKVAQELEVHGTWLDRVVVTQELSRFSPMAQKALLDFESSSEVRIDWLPEILGFGVSSEQDVQSVSEERSFEEPPSLLGPSRRYRYPKQILDLVVAAALLVMTAPLFAAITLIIAIDVGLPVVFWQNRPGRYGQHFKLYKFRTMRAPHDEWGNRIPDHGRVSKLGSLVRLSRLDELPQLYNILVGEMSFVGPRPLILTDHQPGAQDRLLVCPGLTGWAQVNGGRKLSPEDKAALDVWYVAHLSPALDLKIALRTLLLPLFGERINREAVRAAYALRHVVRGAEPVAPRAAKLASTVRSAA